MTVTEPIPTGVYGAANWVDYSNYWREKDAEWMQKRIILRYATAGDRSSGLTSPEFGQVTYNEAVDRLESYSKTQAAWATILQFVNLTSTQDNAAGVNISHKNAAGKGAVFEPAQTQLTNPILVMGGVLYVDATGVSVKTGTKTAKLTTTTTDLVSDSPVSAPGFITGGTLTAATLNVSGKVTTQNLDVSGSLQITGGGTITSPTGTIGSVALTGGQVRSGQDAAGGMQSGQGHFYGDAGSAVMRQRPTAAGAWSNTYVQVTSSAVKIGGPAALDASVFDIEPTIRLWGGKGMKWYDAGGTHRAWTSPTIVSASDPGAVNFPDGTLWVIP